MRTLTLGFVGFGLVAAFVPGCLEKIGDDCETIATCSPTGDGDGDTGGTGDGDGDGDTGTGGAGDGDGDFGGQGGESSGGTGGTPEPCEGSCDDDTPVCDEDTDECVECLGDQHCTDEVCDTDNNVCVECLDAPDCKDPALPLCESNTCTTGCSGNADCERFEDTPVCEVQSGTCVQCTASDFTSCGTDTDSGNAYVCDALTNTCSTTETEGGASLCQSCISNANCQTGQACVLQMFDDTEVGYFCFTKPGVDGNPPTCGRPYADYRTAAEDIEGDTPDICGLRQTTCPALNHFSSPDIDCRPDGMTPDDSLCGMEDLNDGYCRIFQDPPGEENDVYRCTVPCGSADDCKGGFACETGTPDVCEL